MNVNGIIRIKPLKFERDNDHLYLSAGKIQCVYHQMDVYFFMHFRN